MTIFYAICYGMLIISIFCGLYRLFKGPTVVDRMLSFDMITVCVIGLIVLFSITRQTVLFQDLILIFCLMGFASTVAFVFYLHRTDELLDEKKTDEIKVKSEEEK
ncbi:MAG: monovalent cation/H+ antiporter complex subunit F [Verrucomicrobiota bacterium]|nr:monovalent cation/H+ antiporter complex subunit F [Verrucomicrobiota bacterium]